MSRLPPSLALLLCFAATAARADEPRPQPPAVSPSPHEAAKAAAHRPRAKAVPAQAVRPAIAPILGGGAGTAAGIDLAGPARSTGGGDAWSFSPKWSASNGGSSAAYGTRALVNELHANPAETTGYGAGAQVDFHF